MSIFVLQNFFIMYCYTVKLQHQIDVLDGASMREEMSKIMNKTFSRLVESGLWHLSFVSDAIPSRMFDCLMEAEWFTKCLVKVHYMPGSL